ncbi:hypothetical protein N7517_006869 [Penicillium concentricum]|uniref:AGC-kinase C-terminal domain-containing protein n=1 Tax=Penicillium concentricum TaxID=293559 RepID=A0A9W9SEV1_9EURO|nr:uncharacterized protein N7517_006869 [Penicillium concentricum]KAJ5374863.1 hypothetical protein N7517_006869 [Penicillium concentricum]
MPPSTVFSYWRRDHRRWSASPASIPAPSPVKGANATPNISPPQLPEIPDTPTLTTTFDGRPSPDGPSNESSLDIDTSKLNISSSVAPLSSSLTLGVPSPAFEKESRPHSSPGDCGEEQFTSQSNNSQLSVTGLRSDQADAESNSKPSSPFRRSFGKQKRSPTAAAGSGHFRFRASTDDSPADKQTMPQKDFKMDASTTVRRTGDRDVSVEQTHHKSGKAMLHLLNPMSLLARRRSSQMVSSRAEDVKIKNHNVPAMPDDYDPRIRGKIVHDFSAPRPRRNLSAAQQDTIVNGQDTSPPQIPSQPRGAHWNDQEKRHSDHSPVFKEHFEDQNVLQVENKGYLQSSLLTGQSQPGHEGSLPVFARNLPSHIPDGTDLSGQPEPMLDEPPPSPPKAISHAHPQHPQDQDTIPNGPFNPSALPRHLKSNASRFSFDMSGVDSSSQEKMLEEKHKAKEASRRMEDGYFDDFDEDFDDDMMDDLDGLEEKIPGVNADADDDDFDDFSVSRSVSRNINEAKSWAIPGLSPVVGSPITAAPPAPTNTSHFTSHLSESTQLDVGPSQQLPGEQPSPVARIDETSTLPHVPATKQAAQVLDDDDDLYFDDGDFGDLAADNQDGGFDESIFDDVNSHLYERKPVVPAAPLPTDSAVPGRDDSSAGRESPVPEKGVQGLQHMSSVASDYRVTGSVKRGPLGEPIPNMGPARAHGGVLTEQNLDILHNALAYAANEASYSGRFERKFSMSEASQGQDSAAQTSQTIDSQSGLVSDDSRISQAADAMAFEDVFDDQVFDDQVYDGHFYDDYDDSYFDDAIVAAANAEALENDDDGFYGQEFGFYAQADGNGASELTNGGYFGPRRVEGITRNHSSRGKFQEPSLTPITERSEWSTRNSMISVKAHGGTHPNSALASPGLAQLVDMGNLDDEMSLSALMKLRRGAWGGSNGSLRSSAGSPPPHTMSPSHRTSLNGAEASPTVSEARPLSADEGASNSVGHFHDDSHLRTALALSGRPNSEEIPTSGPQRLNVLCYGNTSRHLFCDLIRTCTYASSFPPYSGLLAAEPGNIRLTL